MDHRTSKLMEFLDASVSVYHAAAYLADTLEQAGYVRLQEGDAWELAAGGRGLSGRLGTRWVGITLERGCPRCPR